jgi:hypothetical protein
MWVDPDEDPRNSGGVSPDGELATLQDYLSDYRLTLQMKCEGLHAEQLARRSMPPTMSPLDLLRHLAEVERNWRTGSPLVIRCRNYTAKATPTLTAPSPSRPWSTPRIHEQAATDAILAEHPNPGER